MSCLLCAGALAAALWGTQGTAFAVVLYVDESAPAGGNGQEWATAFTHLQDALAVATAGTEIRIAQGTYRPDRSAAYPAGSGSRMAWFQINNGIVVRGGYGGRTAPDPDSRNLAQYETVLSGDLLGNDQPNFAGMEENSCKVVYLYHGSAGTMLEGVMVRGGNANITTHPFYLRGAGCYVIGGAPAVSQCTFTGNAAGSAGHGSGDGAGVYIVTGPAHVQNCHFYGNKGLGHGGGLYVNQEDAEVKNCVFEENTAGAGGGVGAFACSPQIVGCKFLRNNATLFGGGVFFLGGAGTLTECLLDGNVAEDQGGGLEVVGSGTATVSNCRFVRNQAAYGGGIYTDDDASLGTELTVLNSLFVGNTGSAIMNWHSPGTIGGLIATMRNCTIAYNDIGVRNEGSFPSMMTDCLVWGNGSGLEWQQIGWSVSDIRYSCVQGWSGQYGGTGNFGTNPLLVDVASGDFHLGAASPCIDAGDPGYVPQPGEIDLDRHTRILDGNIDGVARVDIGAYEINPFVVGDANCTGDENGLDVQAFVMAMLDPSSYASSYPNCDTSLADMNGDQVLDALDVPLFINTLLGR